uniref:Apple domain-containing protein n=1 Tax=Macrostomum lignano TaxID=282301 RepID=A0A1I8IEZ8_9PLAT
MKSSVIWLTACAFSLVLCQSVALEHVSAVFELLTSDCPTEPVNAEAVAAQSEPECSLLCTISSKCRLSVYLTDRAVCYRLSAMPPSTGSCGSRMVTRRKLLASEVSVGPSAPTSATPASSLSEASVIQNLSSNFVLWYNFKKSFKNFVNQSVYQAEPVNVTEQSPVDGVRLQGSSGSYVKVSTAEFSKYFAFGKQYSMFFQGKFSCNSVDKCISSFLDVNNPTTPTNLYIKSDGNITARVQFASGTLSSSLMTWASGCAGDSVERLMSFGINFVGMTFSSNAYYNGSMIKSIHMSMVFSGSGSFPKIHDNLLIGNCMSASIKPFDGWLQCWALLTGNLDAAQFDQLRNACSL